MIKSESAEPIQPWHPTDLTMGQHGKAPRQRLCIKNSSHTLMKSVTGDTTLMSLIYEFVLFL